MNYFEVTFLDDGIEMVRKVDVLEPICGTKAGEAVIRLVFDDELNVIEKIYNRADFLAAGAGCEDADWIIDEAIKEEIACMLRDFWADVNDDEPRDLPERVY